MTETKVCYDCQKVILPEEVSQYFSNSKRWYHWSCYQAWSKRMMERAVEHYQFKRERRTA